jgi:hypothetical protein
MVLGRRFKIAIAGVALTLGGCGGAQNLDSALASCNANPSGHAEVYIPRATVVRVLGERNGRSGEHEGFIIAAQGRTYRIEDNVHITGPIPLQRGDTVTLLGQFECNDDVIHWTHHDPRGRHPSGYIEVNSKLYE